MTTMILFRRNGRLPFSVQCIAAVNLCPARLRSKVVGEMRTRQRGTIQRDRCFATATSAFVPDVALLDARNAPSDFTNGSAVVYRDFLTTKEGEVLLVDIQQRMKR